MVEICVFGDLHGQDVNIPAADAYFLTGDLSGLPDEDDLKHDFRNAMSLSTDQTIKFLKSKAEQKHIDRFITSAYEFLEKLSKKAKPVYYVSGNREVIFKLLVTQLNPNPITLENRVKNLKNVECIDGRAVDFFGQRLLGIPFVPSGEWYLENYSKIPGFKSKFEQLRMLPQRLMRIKSDIVLSHCPPYGILDESPGFGHIGIDLIKDYIEKNSPRILFCGHIHESTGIKMADDTVVVNMGTSYYVFKL